MARARYVAVLPRPFCKPVYVTDTYLCFTESFDAAHPPVELSTTARHRFPGTSSDVRIFRPRLKALLRTRHLRKQEVGLIAYLEVQDHVGAYVGPPAHLPGYDPLQHLAPGTAYPRELLVDAYYDLLMLLPLGEGALTLEHIYLLRDRTPLPAVGLVWHRTAPSP